MQVAWGADRRVYAVSGSDLLALDEAGAIRWRVPRVRTLAVTSDGVVAAEADGRLSWFSAAGRLVRAVRLGARPCDVPAIGPDGALYVPTETGQVLVVRDRAVAGRVEVANAAVLRPWLDERRGQLVAVAGDGTVVGVPAGGS